MPRKKTTTTKVATLFKPFIAPCSELFTIKQIQLYVSSISSTQLQCRYAGEDQHSATVKIAVQSRTNKKQINVAN